jgi:hypothetical protein
MPSWPASRALGAEALPDVGHEAAQLDHRTGGVAHQLDLIAHPDDRAVGSHQPVLEVVIAPRLPRLGARRGGAIEVVPVHVSLPEAPPVGLPVRDRETEQPLCPCADEQELLDFGVCLPDHLLWQALQ